MFYSKASSAASAGGHCGRSLSRGTNLLQLSRALGHHSAAFTLSRYTHLLPGDEAPPLDLAAAIAADSGDAADDLAAEPALVKQFN